MSEVNWLSYTFGVYEKNTNWNSVGGLYIFAGLNASNRWVAHYIGQTDDFSRRIPNHEQWSPAVRLGATHVHAMVEQQAAKRDTIEAELIAAYQPALNTQLR